MAALVPPPKRLIIPKAAGVATESPLQENPEPGDTPIEAAPMQLPTQATGPPARAKSERTEPEALDLEWSGEGESGDWSEYPD
jgi:hypothetical protein